MDLKYLILFSIISGSLLALCLFLALRSRKNRLETTGREKYLLERIYEMEKQQKASDNFSILYQDVIDRDRQKTEFFSNITHEIKMPISVILGTIQLMELKSSWEEEDSDMICKNLKVMKINCYRMLRLVNNLLDLTKMDSGYLNLKPVDCNLNRLLEEIVQSVRPYAEQKNLKLFYTMTSESLIAAVDVEKIERILLNLLSNAIKFTPAGGEIRVSSRAAAGRVLISVKDSGIGIPNDKQKDIFGRFVQVDPYAAAATGGSGIGLSLVKSFVNLHHGEIRVESEQGKGSEFIVDLPLRHINEEVGVSNTDSCLFQRVEETARIELSGLQTAVS